MTPTAEDILNEHCPVFSPLFIEKDNKAMMTMRQDILLAMEEIASIAWEASWKRAHEFYAEGKGYSPDKEEFMKKLFNG